MPPVELAFKWGSHNFIISRLDLWLIYRTSSWGYKPTNITCGASTCREHTTDKRSNGRTSPALLKARCLTDLTHLPSLDGDAYVFSRKVPAIRCPASKRAAQRHPCNLGWVRDHRAAAFGCIRDKIMRCKKLMMGSTLLVCAYSARFVLVQHNQHLLAERKHWQACKRYNMGPPRQPSWPIAPKATVYDTYDLILTTIINGDYNSTWNWEAPHCRRSARTAIKSSRSLETIARRAANAHCSLTALPICKKRSHRNLYPLRTFLVGAKGSGSLRL